MTDQQPRASARLAAREYRPHPDVRDVSAESRIAPLCPTCSRVRVDRDRALCTWCARDTNIEWAHR